MRWVALVLVVVVRSAHADPAISLSISESEFVVDLHSLSEHLEEPIGLIALARTPRLGLEKGDVVRTINGLPSVRRPGSTTSTPATVVFLDVLRGGKPVAIRLQIKLKNVDITISRDRFADDIDRVEGRDVALAPITKAGKPSGLLLRDDWFWTVPIKTGDIIRSIDGTAISTIETLFKSLGRAKTRPKFEIDIDRIGQAMAVVIVLEDPPKENPAIASGIANIRKLNDTTYELPRHLVDAALLEPLTAAKGVRIVPNVTNGAPNGYRLYAIRLGSLAEALGFTNGDILLSIDNLDLAAPTQEANIRSRLRTATEFKVVLERSGKALTFVYKVK